VACSLRERAESLKCYLDILHGLTELNSLWCGVHCQTDAAVSEETAASTFIVGNALCVEVGSRRLFLNVGDVLPQ
jgi:hypothetical protein